MTEMVFLQGTFGSKVIFAGCPVCGRIGRQTLPETFSGKDRYAFSASHCCPVCGTQYTDCSNEAMSNWIGRFVSYTEDPDGYNLSARKIYENAHPELRPEAGSDPLDKKVAFWKGKLLDLSKRNRMLNYRDTRRSTLRITEPGFTELFSRLALEESTLTFQRPVDRNTDLRTFSILALLETLSCPIPVRIGDIGSDGSFPERQNTLKNLRAKAKLAKEEQGTNILYLSFGFLEWREKNTAGAQWHRAPLLMMPVTLGLEKPGAPYTLSRNDDEIEVNPTLEYFLQEQFGTALPAFELKTESSAEDYMLSVEKLADAHGWKVTRDVSLGLLSFLKISMYHDLEKNRADMAKHPIIRAIAGETGTLGPLSAEYAAVDLDRSSPAEWFTVVDADSSQQEAILLSKLGISFVMQGPPGTGKSQTITNIIAEALAAGKKVLFVSEKAAALQVVLNRLAEVHLDDFCLSLHSHRANKKEILDAIGRNLKLRHTRTHEGALDELSELFHNREQLNTYAQELHEVIVPLNESLYSVFGKLSELEQTPDLVLSVGDPLSVSEQQFGAMVYAVSGYERALGQMGCSPEENPWKDAAVSTANRIFQNEFLSRTDGLVQDLSGLADIMKCCEKLPGLSLTHTLQGAVQTDVLLRSVVRLPEFDSSWSDSRTRQELLLTARSMSQITDECRLAAQAVHSNFRESIFTEDLSEWNSAVQSLLTQLCTYCGSKDAEVLFADVPAQAEKFSDLRKSLQKLAGEAKNASELLDIMWDGSFESLKKIGSACEALTEVHMLMHKPLTPAELVQAELKLKQVKKHALLLDEKRNTLLKHWNSRVFELDAESMLARFRTEYHGIFHFIRGDYRTDMRTVRACSTEAAAAIEDADVTDLLKSLIDFHSTEKHLSADRAALKRHLGEIASDPAADLNKISAALAAMKKLQSCYPGGIIPNAAAEQIRNGKLSGPGALSEEVRRLQRKIAKLLPSGYGFDVSRSTAAAEKAEQICRSLLAYRHRLEKHLTDTGTVCLLLARQAQTVQELQKRMRRTETRCAELFGSRFRGAGTDWAGIVCELEKAEAFFRTGMHGLPRELVCALSDGTVSRTHIAGLSERLSENLARTVPKAKWFADLFPPAPEQKITRLMEHCQQCRDGFILLDRWLDHLETKKACEALGLGSFIADAQTKKTVKAVDAFKKSFYQQWCLAAIETKPSVRAFRRRTQEERIERFSALDKKQFAIAQTRIREKVIETFPDPTRLLTAGDELRILQRELQKKRRVMPLRKLFKEIPSLLLTLKPCLMMSPLSVAYFLEADSYHFDMVIFDEASQVFPQDAIGAIARGKQVIIAGDSKQLPPTNFFAAAVGSDDFDSEDCDEPIGDSILEEAAGILPSRTLLWHYRSRHEHLIAFSNRSIYGGDLITFPSSRGAEPDTGVEFCYVQDGVYETGKSCNAAEARRCVELVRQHIETHPDRSLGIIAFSEKQQLLISNHVQRFREQNPQYEFFFKEGREEEFFVKNLENVQGDERDTVIFSICYARTAEQKRSGKPMAMRFGPLGHAGGERRLNVAITRARRNIKLVSSIMASDIDLSKTDSEGIRMLRAYIEFARNGSAALHEEDKRSSDSFVNTVAAVLQANGYRVRRQVGCSEYKIDLAVEHPDDPNLFIAGIECDGPSYATARTARDRDRLRCSVLTSMGWNMYRVWSAEWQNNPSVEEEKLLAFLQNIPKNAVPAPVQTAAPSHTEIFPEEEELPAAEAVPERSAGFSVYVAGSWNHASVSEEDPDRFGQQLLHILAIEQPIHTELLYQRMAGAVGRQKITPVVKRTVDNALAAQEQAGKICRSREFWTLTGFSDIRVRIPAPGEQPRPIDHISDGELSLAMLTVAERSFGLTSDKLTDETARALGYARAGERIRKRLEALLSQLTASGQIETTDGRIHLTGR